MSDFDDYSEAELLLFMAEGEEAERTKALEVFYRRYGSYIESLCLRLCIKRGRSSEDAKDLASDVVLRIFEKAETYDESKQDSSVEKVFYVKAWIGQITQNLLVDSWRQQHGISTVSLDSQDDEFPDIAPDNTPSEMLTLVGEALECCLSDDERALVREYFDHKGITNLSGRGEAGVTKLLAEAHNTTDVAVRQRIRRSKNKIREYIEANKGKGA